MNLIQILFAFVIAYIKGESPVKSLSTVMSKENQGTLLKMIPGMKPYIDAYNSGGDLDWEGLSSLVSAFNAAYLKQPDAKASYGDILKTFALWFRTGSASAFTKLEKLSTRVKDQAIPAAFTKEEVDQGPIKDQMTKVVKKLGGSGSALTPDEAREAKVKNPDLYKTYLSLRKQYSESWKTALSNYVRNSGKTMVPFKEVEAYFKTLGIQHTMPTGFTGNIDAKGTWYTSSGKEIQGVPAAALFPTVKMNPKPDHAPWVFQTVRNTGELGNQFYTLEFQRNQAQQKFAKVADFNPDKIKGEWRSLITGFDYYNPKCVAAIVIELLYRSSHRVGTTGGNASGGGFGICTLQKQHFYPQTDGGIKFMYLGKDNVKFTYKLSPNVDQIAKKICEVVHEMAKDKKPRDALFTYWTKGGKPKHLTPQVVNAVFGSMSGGLTIHKLRTYKGTKLFREYLASVFSKRTNVSSGDAMELLRKGATLVGKELNHVKRSADGSENVTPNTAIKNYIDPSAQAELFLHYGLPLPSYLEKLVGGSEIASLVTASDGTPAVKPVAPVKPVDTPTQPPAVAPVKPVAPVQPTQPTAPPAPVAPAPQPAPAQTPPQQPVAAPQPVQPQVPQPHPDDVEEPIELRLDPRMESYLSGETDLWQY